MEMFWAAVLTDSTTMSPKISSSLQEVVLIISAFNIISYPSMKDAKYVLCK